MFFTISLIIGAIFRLFNVIFDFVIRFTVAFIKGLYCLIAYGENPFDKHWAKSIGFVKFAAVMAAIVLMWNNCIDTKSDKNAYRMQKACKVEAIKTSLFPKKNNNKTLTYTIAETARK